MNIGRCVNVEHYIVTVMREVPALTWRVDITASLGGLGANMHSTTIVAATRADAIDEAFVWLQQVAMQAPTT